MSHHSLGITIGTDVRASIRAALRDWSRMLSPRDMRKIESDRRALFLGTVLASMPDDPPLGWNESVDAARAGQARILIRVRACQLTGRFDLAKTVLQRASVFATIRKPMRKARDRVLAKWAAEDAETERRHSITVPNEIKFQRENAA